MSSRGSESPGENQFKTLLHFYSAVCARLSFHRLLQLYALDASKSSIFQL